MDLPYNLIIWWRGGRATCQSHFPQCFKDRRSSYQSGGSRMEEVHTLYKSRIAFGEKLQLPGEWFGKGCEGQNFVMAILFAGPSSFCCDRWSITQKVILKPREILQWSWCLWRHCNLASLVQNAPILYEDWATEPSQGLGKCLSFQK